MTVSWRDHLCFAAITLFAFGCAAQSEPPTANAPSESADDSAGNDGSVDAGVETAMAKLSPEDRLLAEAQKFCAVENSSPLGSMGTPVKLDINGESVFLCCSGCQSAALEDPEKTLAAVAKLKADSSSSDL